MSLRKLSNILVWKFCGTASAEFRISTKFPHQEIRWNYGILRIACWKKNVDEYLLLKDRFK